MGAVFDCCHAQENAHGLGDAALAAEAPSVRMILQVHDELVFEVPRADAEALGARIREWMEGVLPLRVPLVVDVGSGRNWREAH